MITFANYVEDQTEWNITFSDWMQVSDVPFSLDPTTEGLYFSLGTSRDLEVSHLLGDPPTYVDFASFIVK